MGIHFSIHHQESLDKKELTLHILHTVAEVAELVDALGSGSSGGSPVEVRVFSSAPDFEALSNDFIEERLLYSGGCISAYFSLSSLLTTFYQIHFLKLTLQRNVPPPYRFLCLLSR